MNVESSVFVNVFYLVLLVIYVLCKLYHGKKRKEKKKQTNKQRDKFSTNRST